MTAVPACGFPQGVPGYQSLGFLGQGASGQVFKARQRSTGQFVAIKVPSVPAARDPAGRRRVQQRLHQETRLLALLQHTHVVRLIDKGVAQGNLPFAVLEYLPGQTLRDYLQRHGRLSLLETVGLMAQLLDALAFLHIHQVVHRDLKPENVMVVSSGTALHAKLLDFGLASHHGSHAAAGAGGTPAYCAPEQLRGEVCVPATDIYAWALMFVECLHAQPCVQGPCVSDVLARQLSHADVALPKELHGSPLAALLQRALHKDLRQRAADTAQLYRELAQCLAQLHAVPALQKLGGGGPGPPPPLVAGSALHPTLDAPAAPRPAPGAAPAAVLSLTLRLHPASDASLALPELQHIRAQQQQACTQAVLAGQGRSLGVLGDSLLYCFDSGQGTACPLQQAADLAQVLCARLQRASRVLAVQHGVRLAVSGGLHAAMQPLQSHAANRALYLNSLAGSGMVVLCRAAHGALAGRIPLQAHPVAGAEEEVYRWAVS